MTPRPATILDDEHQYVAFRQRRYLRLAVLLACTAFIVLSAMSLSQDSSVGRVFKRAPSVHPRTANFEVRQTLGVLKADIVHRYRQAESDERTLVIQYMRITWSSGFWAVTNRQTREDWYLCGRRLNASDLILHSDILAACSDRYVEDMGYSGEEAQNESLWPSNRGANEILMRGVWHNVVVAGCVLVVGVLARTQVQYLAIAKRLRRRRCRVCNYCIETDYVRLLRCPECGAQDMSVRFKVT